MIKEVLLVGVGSFVGGGARHLVSRMVQTGAVGQFPLATFIVNVVGCLLIGFLSALRWTGGWMSPEMRLLLTTGFCGGFTTFSTFMNENASLASDGRGAVAVVYAALSLSVGLAAVWAGQQLAGLVK